MLFNRAGSEYVRLDLAYIQKRRRIILLRYIHKTPLSERPYCRLHDAQRGIPPKHGLEDRGRAFERFETDNASLGKPVSYEEGKLSLVGPDVHNKVEVEPGQRLPMFHASRHAVTQRTGEQRRCRSGKELAQAQN